MAFTRDKVARAAELVERAKAQIERVRREAGEAISDAIVETTTRVVAEAATTLPVALATIVRSAARLGADLGRRDAERAKSRTRRAGR